MNTIAPPALTGRLVFVWASGLVLAVLNLIMPPDWDGTLGVLGFFYFFVTRAISPSVKQNVVGIGDWIDQQVATPTTGLIGHFNTEETL